MAGYSGTPLARKLAIKPGHVVALVDAPAGFAIPDLPDVTLHHDVPTGPVDTFLLFARQTAALAQGWSRCRPQLVDTGSLWVAFYKQAALKRMARSGFETDLSGDLVRAYGLGQGLVDTKVCAIDDDWTGLRFMVRKADRGR